MCVEKLHHTAYTTQHTLHNTLTDDPFSLRGETVTETNIVFECRIFIHFFFTKLSVEVDGDEGYGRPGVGQWQGRDRAVLQW